MRSVVFVNDVENCVLLSWMLTLMTLMCTTAQAVCSPTRTAFMSGRYPLHTSINEWIPPNCAYGLPLNETTIADELTAAGYDSHAVGKWHCGFFKYGMTPTNRGTCTLSPTLKRLYRFV